VSGRVRSSNYDMAEQGATFSDSSAASLESALVREYGALIGGARLTKVLGYPSQAAFRQAVARKRLPIPVFAMDGRRGKFALARDIALWLITQSRSGVRHPTRRIATAGDLPAFLGPVGSRKQLPGWLNVSGSL